MYISGIIYRIVMAQNFRRQNPWINDIFIIGFIVYGINFMLTFKNQLNKVILFRSDFELSMVWESVSDLKPKSNQVNELDYFYSH